MSHEVAVARFSELRHRSDSVDQDDLHKVWAELPPANTAELMGAWRGGLFDTGHPHNRRGEGAPQWHGKHVISTDVAKPDVCRAPDGTLYATGTNASLWMIEFRGEVTASLVYDSEPVLDHFKHVDAQSLLGVMNRAVDRESDDWLYFWLEREDVPLLG